MKLIYDKSKLKESVELGAYDTRGLTISRSGKHCYPSKKMFIDFLKQFKDIDAIADIWSEENWSDDTVTIHVEVTYNVPDMPVKAKQRQGVKNGDVR